ncbi:hypothetical protein JHJ32_21150 [Parapedobacter sp. ISTM3]|uniref:toxin-antitoxin system YwqK family antitoxin n=1 Tax=Parapedobacter sp. ISTM3 TaxID=2800130 RepID=UPI0019077BF6|nr:hypothetical protein [Parapedobacter sp. ISTM3]MBK1442520.1 hypothetical protein [Parapedobacter sp. ISTM3]
MKRRYVLLVCWACLSAICPAMGQRYLEDAIPYQNSALLRTDEGFIEVRFTRKTYVGGAEPHVAYHTYYRDSIYVTQGGYHGQPLHGQYLERYANRSLKVLGSYTYGLKSGKWQYWDERGVLRKVSRWKAGSETGKFSVYGETGHLQQSGRLKDGGFDGIIRTHHASGDSLTHVLRRYRRGKEVSMEEGSLFSRMYDKVRALF